MKYILLTLFFITFAHSATKVQLTTFKQDQGYFFFAFEEASFIRKEIGDWLAKAVLKKENQNSNIYIIIKNGSRKNQKDCELKFEIHDDDGLINWFKFFWTAKGKDGPLDYTIRNEQGNWFFVFRDDNDNERRLAVFQSKSLDSLQQSLKMSKAQPLWKWDTAHVIKY